MRYLLCLVLVLLVSCSCPEPEEASEPTLEDLVANRLDDLHAEQEELLGEQASADTIPPEALSADPLQLPFERREITSVEEPLTSEVELDYTFFDEGWRGSGEKFQQTFETQAQREGNVFVTLEWDHIFHPDTQLLVFVGGTQVSTGTVTSSTSIGCYLYDPGSRLIHIMVVYHYELEPNYELTVTEDAD